MTVGDGRETRFWHSNWLGECPLKILYLELYKRSMGKNEKVASIVSKGPDRATWDVRLDLRRVDTSVE
ncbi:hypothetical protein AMTR_s00154p00089130 [Amborella trichopoda]|uniref:Reverse transcriptase zinc-binding domain-containing protein n=1 Tax=Amborella trichopoda TaxID=13333 RepID=W1PKC0_AMBTC|nr:hypothetical protein AMTR_s00154p00089130 [Amborella trichopoda]